MGEERVHVPEGVAMKRYKHAERMIRGIVWQGKMELYAVLLDALRRVGTTEHELQHEADKYRRAATMQRFGATERQIESMLKESDEMNTNRASGQEGAGTTWQEQTELAAAHAQKCSVPVPKSGGDPAKRVAWLQQELAEAEVALAAKTERDALAAKIDDDIALAEATRTLLADIRVLRVAGNQLYHRNEFAQYREELAAIAKRYGVRIVLVGDKTAATLVLQ